MRTPGHDFLEELAGIGAGIGGQIFRGADRNDLVAGMAQRLVAYTDDFARHSRYLSKYLPRVTVIPPPVEMPVPAPEAVAAFRQKHGLDQSGPVIGLASRLAAEKGIEYLLEALPRILERYPNTRVLHAGPREAIGEATGNGPLPRS